MAGAVQTGYTYMSPALKLCGTIGWVLVVWCTLFMVYHGTYMSPALKLCGTPSSFVHSPWPEMNTSSCFAGSSCQEREYAGSSQISFCAATVVLDPREVLVVESTKNGLAPGMNT